jgi:hypothetical protein
MATAPSMLAERRARQERPAQAQIVNPNPRYPKPRLIQPTTRGYVYLAGHVRSRFDTLPFVLPNARRSKLLARLKALAGELERLDDVVQATVFRAIVRPPTANFSDYLKSRQPDLHVANFDVMLLIQTSSPTAVQDVQASPLYRAVVEAFRSRTEATCVIEAQNARRIGDVDTTRPGLFLFNHFAADDPDVMLDLWEYLAGWYAVETGLDNSVALTPTDRSRSDYAIVNWARWDEHPLLHFWHQLSKPSFWSYVTGNLEANHAGSMPVYCRLA